MNIYINNLQHAPAPSGGALLEYMFEMFVLTIYEITIKLPFFDSSKVGFPSIFFLYYL